MNEEQNKQTLLVDQDKALAFYFDSLLLSDDAQSEQQNGITENKHTAIEKKSKSIQTPPDDTPQVVQKKKIITSGPVSPKPRETEKKPMVANIVFSEKDKDGSLVEQVLIPRSQRLQKDNNLTQMPKPRVRSIGRVEESQQPAKPPQQKKSPEVNSVTQYEARNIEEKSNIELNIEKSKPVNTNESLLSQTQRSIQSASQSIPKPIEIIEAPKLDLSLFLPKIQTLSDEEIKEQISTLSQVSSSQAQLESDLARVAKLEQDLQQKIKIQEENNALVGKTPNAPAWAESGFQVLLFSIAGLKLAVPLNELNGILEWGDDYINELPGHASWYLGLIRNQGINIPVVDTLQQVVPKNRWPENYANCHNFKHIILIDDSHWGLACESVIEVINLQADSVKWRSSRTKRRWLLGTVIDQMCALLDTSEFSAMLKTGDDSLLTGQS